MKRRRPSIEVAATRRQSAREVAVAAAPLTPVPARDGYVPLINTAFQATASRVQEMHHAISGKTFGTLLSIPGLGMPTRIVQGVHDAITQGVYAAVRHGGGAALSLAADAEYLASDPARIPGAREQALRSALNGVVGDSLVGAGSALAISMGLHRGGRPLAVEPGSLDQLRPRVCLFLHGLACDERSWSLRGDGWAGSPWEQALPPDTPIDYGTLLESELGVSAVYLRYNTGQPIDANAHQLAALLQRAALAAPQVQEWLLIGHSMGGLVARRAHAMAMADGLSWAARAPMIICLGSPHQGAPLEKLGHLASSALQLSTLTEPVARLANARSQGIKDLRQGLKRVVAATSMPAPMPVPTPALRMMFATLGDATDSVTGSLLGKVFGDGLVLAGSASDVGTDGDVQRVEVAGL
ncbi:MAG: hypothetical protein ABIQ60_01225, partial [Burkholderiaceae bacterium]